MSQGVAKLKELLFETEARALTDLQRRIEAVAKLGTEQRAALSRDLDRLAATDAAFRNEVKSQIDAVFSRAGTDDRFRASVAEVLDRALADAEISRHEQLSTAIAPLVVRTIKREIHESQDELVDALYPITGRLVQAYVASAIRELSERINAQMSANPAMLRFKSLLTGRSRAELALVQSQQLQVEELYLIRRGSGELLARWPDVSNSHDRDQVLSGILTAINEFSLEAFPDDGSALREIDLNTSRVYLRASPRLLLAAKCTGLSNAAVERMIDAEFMESLNRQHYQWEELADNSSSPTQRNALLSEVAERIENRVADVRRQVLNDNSGWLVLKSIGWLIGLLLAGWIAWAGYKYATTEWVRERANAVIAQTVSMRGYPVRLQVADYGAEVSLAGLAPSAEAKTEIIDSLKSELAGIAVKDELTIVPTAPDATPQIVGLREDLQAFERRVAREAFERSTARAIIRLAALPASFSQLGQKLEEQSKKSIVAAAASNVDTVRTELAKLRSQEAGAGAINDNARLDNSELAARLAALRATIAASAVRMAGLLDTASARLDAGAPLDADAPFAESAGGLLFEAESMAIETEQLATLVVALAQAAGIKPPPPIVMAPPPPPAPSGPTPDEQLASWIRVHAIFFSTDTRFRDLQAASSHLDELAELIQATLATIRVVGFTDEQGSSRQNSPLSRERAELVRSALITRGVPEQRLIAVGRLDAKDISSISGDSSPNRRVEFEFGFVGEAP
ncbi:MAG: hypothetical protein APF80_03850 [Alphaproteobacteria bacterium BRH_c36]|nr:MAG: hypothetical protein APF80_03850 [Alphaproteobacteria bacterium BRH_c36]